MEIKEEMPQNMFQNMLQKINIIGLKLSQILLEKNKQKQKQLKMEIM